MNERFEITCPKCGRVGKTSTEPAAGAKVRCPGCKGQFAYQPEEAFVVVEPPPGTVKPAPAPPIGDKTWLYVVGGTVVASLAVMALVASSKPDASLGVTILGGLVLAVVLASPVVLVVCLLIMLVKYVAKQTMREMDADREERT